MKKYALIENNRVVALVFNEELLDSITTNYVELSELQYELLGDNFMDFEYTNNSFIHSPPIFEIVVEPVEEDEL
jgi:hypothetical protein